MQNTKLHICLQTFQSLGSATDLTNFVQSLSGVLSVPSVGLQSHPVEFNLDTTSEFRSQRRCNWVSVNITDAISSVLASPVFAHGESSRLSLSISVAQPETVHLQSHLSKKAHSSPFLSFVQTRNSLEGSTGINLKKNPASTAPLGLGGHRQTRSAGDEGERRCSVTTNVEDGSLFLPRDIVEFHVQEEIVTPTSPPPTQPASPLGFNNLDDLDLSSMLQDISGDQPTTSPSTVTSTAAPVTREVTYVLPSFAGRGLVVHRCRGTCQHKSGHSVPIHYQAMNLEAIYRPESAEGQKNKLCCVPTRFADDPFVSVLAKDNPTVFKRIPLKNLHATECSCTWPVNFSQ